MTDNNNLKTSSILLGQFYRLSAAILFLIGIVFFIDAIRGFLLP